MAAMARARSRTETPGTLKPSFAAPAVLLLPDAEDAAGAGAGAGLGVRKGAGAGRGAPTCVV